MLINVYAPNKDKDQLNFFNNLLSILQNENLDSVDNIIIGGDLNCSLDPLLDKKGGASTKRKSVISCVEDFKSKLDLVDIWRSKNPDAKSFTWSQKSPPSVLWSRLLVFIIWLSLAIRTKIFKENAHSGALSLFTSEKRFK